MPFPDYLDQNPKIIFFTDFDGTVTIDDMCDWLVETKGYGLEELRKSSQAVIDGTMAFRDASLEQLDSIQIGFDECEAMMKKHAQLDKHFLDFYKWAKSVNMPIIVLSGGLKPWIETILQHFELRDIEVVANSVTVKEGFGSINEDGGWRVQFLDDSGYGNDKAKAIKPYAEHLKKMGEAERPLLLYAGDGISDLGAAGQTDLLFAKQGKDLIKHCEEHHIPFVEFPDWASILSITQDLFYGRKSKEDVVEESLNAIRKSDTSSHS